MRIPRRAVVAGYTSILSDRMLNDLRFQYAFAAYEIAPPGQLIWTDVGEYPVERIGPQRVARRLTFPSLVYGGNYEALGPEKRFQIRDTFSYHAPDWLGAHDLKVGGDFSHIPFADDSQVNINGTYQFGADQAFDPNDPASIANLRGPILFTMTTPANYVPMPSQYLGLFVQDDWRPTPTLTINVGLRYDLQIGAFNTDVRPDRFRIPIPLIDASTRGDNDNFGPRAGFAWDVNHTGATVVRGGYGRYFDNIRLLQNQYEKLNMLRYDIRISNPSYPDPFLGRDPLQFASTAPPNIQLLANDFRSPSSDQTNLGVTRQLTSDLAVHVDGVYSRVTGDRKPVNVNLPVNGVQPYPQFGRIDVDQSISKSSYRALYVRLDRRPTRYQYLVSYSHAPPEFPEDARVLRMLRLALVGELDVDSRQDPAHASGLADRAVDSREAERPSVGRGDQGRARILQRGRQQVVRASVRVGVGAPPASGAERVERSRREEEGRSPHAADEPVPRADAGLSEDARRADAHRDHANTAYALKLLLEHARLTNYTALADMVVERGRKFYGADYGCAPNVELSGSDFFSPCLVEAAFVGEIMQPSEFAAWLDRFIPAPDTPAFKSLLTVNMEMPGTAEDLKRADMLGAKAHLVGLGVSRARAFEDIAGSLPPADPRVAIYRDAATKLAQISITSMYDASYEGTHWIATYIVDYLISQQRRVTTTTQPQP
jgi:Protein of unknown function (DUF2891)/TonB dependent receptor-like, beta-barrel